MLTAILAISVGIFGIDVAIAQINMQPSSPAWTPIGSPMFSLQDMNTVIQSSLSNFMNNFGNPAWLPFGNGGGMPGQTGSPMHRPSGPSGITPPLQPSGGNSPMNRPFNNGRPIGNSQSGIQQPMNRPMDSAPNRRPPQTAGNGNTIDLKASGPARNTQFWQNWFQNRGNEQNFVFNTDLLNQNNSAGYETDDYCIYDLRMSYIYGSPDGVQKRIIGFNGQFPGPTLRCTNGKTMIVRVTNDIQDDEPTSIHWHGIQQNLSPFYDGPQSITQCPVIRSNSMIYKFQIFQSGTYWYHSHHSYQYVDGAWGFLVIGNTPEECWANSYDDERLISVNDWTHRPAKDISEFYLTRGNFPDTNSSLINGRGTFNCSAVERGQVCNKALQGPAVINVAQGKRYRFRILNSSAARSYNFSIDGHKMVVIETDGVDTVKSPKVDTIPLLPAQRYSVIINMDQPTGEYWIRTSGEPATGAPAGLQGRAILRYTPNPNSVQTRAGQLLFSEPTQPGSGAGQGRPDYHDIPWEDIINSGGVKVPTREELQKYFPNQPPKLNFQLQSQLDAENVQIANQTPLPKSSSVDPSRAVLLNQNMCRPLQFGADGKAPTRYDQIVTLNMTDCPIAGQPVRMCMNGQPFVAPSITSPPVLYQLITGERVRASARPIYLPNRNEVIWLVINNRHQFPHPWHLHGHTFWVMGSGTDGAGDFILSRDISKLTTDGARRDTTFTLGRSWAVVAFRTDNPGAWFFHCHINWHLEAGLGVTFIEGGNIARRVYQIPPKESTQTCARVGVTI